MAFTEIDRPSDYFNTVLYTGNGTSQSITGVGFQPEWTWIKCRSDARNHQAYDVVRGATKQIYPNLTNAEDTDASSLTSFDSDGFSVGSAGAVNVSSQTFVSWNWLAGGTAVSNTQGSITSSVSANTTSGFSIVSYTGNGTADATVGHGLGVTPSFFVVKNRQDGTTNWNCYHKSLGKDLVMQLSTTSGQISVSNYWGTTGPTSTTIQLLNDGNINASGQTLICYAFAEKKGFSKFGSYTGNGSTNGTFVYTGFKPAYLLVKRTDTAGYDWQEFDNKINPYNVASICLRPNVSNGDQVGNAMDLLSNGFKNRLTGGTVNHSGASYIYMAFAENPFTTSTGIPVTAR